MVGLPRGINNRGGDVIGFQERIVPKNFFMRRAGSKKIKNVADADAMTAYAGATAAYCWIDRDSGKNVVFHRGYFSNR